MMSGNIDQSDIDWFLYKMSPLEIDKGVSVAACCMAPILGIDSSQWNLFHCLCGGFAGVNVWIVLFPSPVRWVEKTIRSPWNEANRKLQASKIFCICTMQWLPITRKKKNKYMDQNAISIYSTAAVFLMPEVSSALASHVMEYSWQEATTPKL